MSRPALLSALDRLSRVSAEDGLLAAASALGAAGRTQELASLVRVYLERGHDPAALYETLLQLYLFAGFPRAINALAVLAERLQAAGLAPPSPAPAPEGQDLERWHRLGEELCRRIYGGSYDKLRARMREISPDLDRWMVLEGYGKVLSRPALPPARRECGVLGALVALGAERQLESHLRGCLNLGLEPAALLELVDLLAALFPPREMQRARALFERVAIMPRDP